MRNINLENDNESEIASMAARLLREHFIAAAQDGPVLYVENDYLVRKAPNELPVIVKKLSGRNPNLIKKIAGRRTFKIRKQQVKLD